MPIISLVSPTYLNVKQYGAVGDGSTDSTAAIAAARAVARAAGGGIIFYPPGTYVTGNQDISNDANVYHLGSGIGATTIRLKNGANTDLFSAQTGSINLSGTFGTGPLGTLSAFGFANMTLDGNKANQSSGTSYPLRFYGYEHYLENLLIFNGYTGGILCDFRGTNSLPADGFEPKWVNVGVYGCNGIGIELGGPSDMQTTNVIVGRSGSHCLHVCPNAGGLMCVNGHFWSPGAGKVGVLIEAPSRFVNCESESSDTAQVVLLSSNVIWSGGALFSTASLTGTGIILGQTNGATAYAGQIQAATGIAPANYYIHTLMSSIYSTNGNVQFVQDGGGLITAMVDNTHSSTYTGTPGGTSSVLIQAIGATADGSSGKSPTHRWRSKAFFGFNIGNYTVDMLNADTFDQSLQVVNGTPLSGYSGNYTGQTWVLDSNAGSLQLGAASTLFSGSGVPSNATGNNGDYYFRSGAPGTANQRIYVKSAGAWVGIV